MKNKIVLAAILSIFNMHNDIEAMHTPAPKATVAEQVDLTNTLSEWPKVNPMTHEEFIYYQKETWNPQLTLKQNQERLLQMFLDTCCDFSFKTLFPGIDNVLFAGKTDSGNEIAFFNEGNYKTVKLGGRIHILSETFGEICSFSPTTFRTTLGTISHIYDINEQIKSQLIGYFSILSQDPVGCKLLRIAVSKFFCNKTPKIVFIPQKGFKNKFEYTGLTKDDGRPINYLLFPYDVEERRATVSTISFDKLSNDFIIAQQILPIEAFFLHEIIHAIHHIDKTYSNSNEDIVIRQRYGNCRELTTIYNGVPVTIPAQQIQSIWSGYLENDEEYSTMFGPRNLGRDLKLDLLNESAYLSGKYHFIRIAHLETETWTLEDNGELFKDFVKKLFINFP